MSAPKRPSDDQDPDYAPSGPTNAKQQKIYEETARKNTANKIRAIVEKEFGKEIDDKEKEVLEIQNRLHKALKTLHLLRYVVIKDFYNRKECLATQSADAAQTQIHPAVKRLIGKTPKRRSTIGLEDPGPSTSTNFEGITQSEDKNEVEACSEPSEIERRLGQFPKEEQVTKSEEKISANHLSNNEADCELVKKVPRYIPPKNNVTANTGPPRGVRHKVRKRIVVGNISKWIPPDWREDGASHKWMIYVRGSKDAPDITDFVSTIRFFLHPSYQPNDVVQVASAPFHLSRRGWGEFPVRVQLHFKNLLNKPMDIIHHLKLDRTYTGLQTLGSETVVDIWIHMTSSHDSKENFEDAIASGSTLGVGEEAATEKIKVDSLIIKEENRSADVIGDLVSVPQSSIKVEPSEDDSEDHFTEANSYLGTENCINMEHNYVSNLCRTEHTEIVHSMENNITIKHSVSSLKEEDTGIKTADNDNHLINNAEDTDVTSPNVGRISKDIEDECSPSQTLHNNVFSAESQPAMLDKNEPHVPEEENIKQRTEALQHHSRNLLYNGDVNTLPIKLVKRNDKFFLMTDAAKFSNNKVELTKKVNSDVVKNILVKKIQPGKVSILKNTDIRLREMTELINGQNRAQTNAPLTRDSSTLDKGTAELELQTDQINSSKNECILENNTKIELKSQSLLKCNSQQLEMQKLASSLRSIPSKSEPLRITIPQPFELNKKRQILVLKNNKLISVNAGNNLSLTSVLNSKQTSDTKTDGALVNKNKLSVLTTTMRPNEGTSLLKPSVSILKKPTVDNNLTKVDASKHSKPPTILKINPSNSLLLNANSNIPALQIVTPLHNVQGDNRLITIQNPVGQMKLKRLPKYIKIDSPEDCQPQKVSVTLGKDKHKILSKQDTYEETLRSIETIEIKDIFGIMRYIMKRMPLVTPEARDSDYRQMHPYACCTQEEFFNFPVGKQRAHEWYRAKAVRSLIRKKGFENEELWSTREILLWARHHGYTPVQTSLSIEASSKTCKTLSNRSTGRPSTCTEFLEFTEWLEDIKDLDNPNEESDIEIDVVHISDTKVKSEVKSEDIDPLQDCVTLEVDSPLELPCAFVNETARAIGIKFQKEEIVPGVKHCAVQRVIVEAMQCLIDDLMRRSLAKAWERSSNKCPDTILLDDVRGAILSREEFDVFTNEGLGSIKNILENM
ncbi:YEATS domain-containing protein 2 [Athalia rosae]|uniref:YEATS domain-containing protein 2 n=1 Tax=Athalia rosae TaxID=37344 RepID=UPI0020348CE6|nr:YEATS domain-containing protein 2 [Athalia rosae]XP_012254144.2 YEATS domain-containing protein 2 [Athalia rosae]